MYVALAHAGHSMPMLWAQVGVENFTDGLADAAFLAYLSSLTNVNYSATQYALFSSMMLLLPKWLAGFSGKYVEQFGYEHFFTATACLGAPVLLLVWFAARMHATAAAPAAVRAEVAP
jgi:PAT family beta-lactamase induction signal transducer AmpG